MGAVAGRVGDVSGGLAFGSGFCAAALENRASVRNIVEQEIGRATRIGVLCKSVPLS
jgi:hypothetical protein